MALWVAWRPIVRDEESADGHPGPQQTSGGPLLFSGLAFLDVHVGGGASVPGLPTLFLGAQALGSLFWFWVWPLP